MAPFLIRVHGLSVEDAGLLLALTYGVGGMIGMPLGGVITDAIRKRRPGRELGTFGIVHIVVALIPTAAFLAQCWPAAISFPAVSAAGAVLYLSFTVRCFVPQPPYQPPP